ncbi:hypothetical protein GUJ93_ZPchr0005g14929 [Zizania palustris]|uniref:MYND-type domain-containing protein n=1 Tax=Zizania palustris TaxID=103762 RepID=A0A8J5SXT7_ZIZPA|nr:hypothetical protein GUJ93_ZPchr0005g14929 [Zizania palustris]
MAPPPSLPEKSLRRATSEFTVPVSETSCSSQSCFVQSRTAVLNILPKFNASGGEKTDRDLPAWAALCFRAAMLGHVDVLRELGHCLQDGYGVDPDPAEGRRLLVAANARELTLALAAAAKHRPFAVFPLGGSFGVGGCPLLSDFGWSLPEAEPHPANQFMVDWWSSRDVQPSSKKPVVDELATADSDGGELCLCSHVRCGRRETRRHEFRRCSVCSAANYCSRACQALDWKRAHRAQCVPMRRWLLAGRRRGPVTQLPAL